MTGPGRQHRIRRPSGRKRAALTAVMLVLVLLVSGCEPAVETTSATQGTPTVSPVPTPTQTQPSATPTPTPMPTPFPTPVPYIAPGTPSIDSSRLHARILSLTADPSSWNADDAEQGWFRCGDVFLFAGTEEGESAEIMPGVSIGTPIDQAVDATGKPLRNGSRANVFFFDSLVLVFYGDETVEAAAFWGRQPGTSATQIVRRLCDTLYEYDRVVVRQDGKNLPSADGRFVLSYFDGEQPFLAVYPAGDPIRWIPLHGASREHYWVNAHTFLRIEADTLRPACHAFDIEAEWPAERIRSFPLLDLHQVDPEIRIDMKYASEDNFVHTDLYGDLSTVYLPEEAARRLAAAHEALRADYPHLRFLVYDIFRPKSVQQRMWDMVQGTEYEAILSDPEAWFSNHYIGMALDLTLFDTTTGQELDMGTGFDSFDRLAWPRYEAEFLASGRLSREQHENRLILRRFMEAQGFTQLYFEWWQFDLHMPGGIPAMFKWFE